jgi:hypothetical protein
MTTGVGDVGVGGCWNGRCWNGRCWSGRCGKRCGAHLRLPNSRCLFTLVTSIYILDNKDEILNLLLVKIRTKKLLVGLSSLMAYKVYIIKLNNINDIYILVN